MSIIQQIEQNLKWLSQNVNSQDVSAKLQKVEELSHNCYYLSDLVGEAHEAKNDAEVLYKTSVDSYVANAEGSQSRAEVKAKELYKDSFIAWKKAENIYKKYQLKLSAAGVVIEQVRQTCSYLKQEKRYESQ